DYLERRARAVIDDVTASTYMKREEFTAPIQYIPIKNGVLDISQNPVKLLKHDKKYYFTKQLPVAYHPEAECPKFLKFLSEILPDETHRLQVQEMFGWSLWRDYSHQIAFILIGEGSNGRSTLLNVLRSLLGDRNVAALSLQCLCKNRFAVAELYQKFADIAPDIPRDKIEDSSAFKNLTGGDLLTAEKKFRNPFRFVNYAKLIFSANKLPYSKDKTYAYYRRWMLILFNIRFGDGGQPVDKRMLEKITTPEELSGILNWALEGLKRLNEQGDFTGRMSVAETEKYYERLVSPVYMFLSDCIAETKDPQEYIPKDYLWDEVLRYCQDNNLPKPKSKKQIASSIKRNFKGIETAQRTIDGKLTWVWLYCRFTDDAENVKLKALLDSETPKSTLEKAFNT
ncbi:MAG: phage/plasmid primase, P4 family, partial [Candidatus Bathyarchaeota archaeon]|nr:phage/plasmid primase, P4 family [Candidatus Bathyarchaeota archaeon]